VVKNKFKGGDAEKMHKDWQGVTHYTIKVGYICCLISMKERIGKGLFGFEA